MNNENFLSAVQAEFNEAILGKEETYGMLSLEVAPDKVLDIAKWAYNHPEFQVKFMTDLCGVHYPEQPNKEMGVVYHFHSLTNNFRFRMKTFMPKANPILPSMTPLFKTANWMERETFDFYGIQFEGHPDLRRILNMDEMDYHPLLKEYALEDETRDDKSDKFFGR